MELTKQTKKIEQFITWVQCGIDAWSEAGRILNEMIAEDSNARSAIMDRIPWMTYQILVGFERIGRNEIYPHLLLDKSPGAHVLITLPYEEQKRLHSAEIAIACVQRGEIITTHRKLQDMTKAEAELAMGGGSLRPVAEQSKLLLSKLRPKETRAPREVKECHSKIPESLDDDPNETAEMHLAKAQAEMIRARELFGERAQTAPVDALFVTALNCIGRLRLLK